jgi:hypothetical protein
LLILAFVLLQLSKLRREGKPKRVAQVSRCSRPG